MQHEYSQSGIMERARQADEARKRHERDEDLRKRDCGPHCPTCLTMEVARLKAKAR